MIELIVRVVFSLLVVIALMWGLARLARRPMGGRRGALVTVLGRQQLSKGAAVAVVRVADRTMVLGVTDGHVSLLGETELPATEERMPEPEVRRRVMAVRRRAVALDELPALAGQLSSPAPTGGTAVADPLAGSLLSPRTWRQAARFLRTWTAHRS